MTTAATDELQTSATGRRWISVHDIARDLGVSDSTVYKWSARGRPWFPRSIRLKNGDIRVRRDWYDVARQRHGTTLR